MEAVARASTEIGAEAYYVGGCVRDAILGIAVKDLDVMAAVGVARKLAERLENILGEKAARHERFGTYVFGRLDIASARREVYPRPGALPAVTLGASVREDLARRDFTVNAMAVPAAVFPGASASALREAAIDPFGGLKDLDRRVLRILHEKSFLDDPTRLVRAARFAARFGFAPDAETLRLIRAAVSSGAPDMLTKTRAGRELVLMSREPEPPKAFSLLESWGAAGKFYGKDFAAGRLTADFMVKYGIPRSDRDGVAALAALLKKGDGRR